MVITLGAELESALNEMARKKGVAPEDLAVDALRQRFLASQPRIQARDEWERRLLALAKDAGVSLSNVAVSSEGLYE